MFVVKERMQGQGGAEDVYSGFSKIAMGGSSMLTFTCLATILRPSKL